MMVCTQLSGSNAANATSSRAVADRGAMWHLGAGVIPTVGTGFKPYDQRPKERLQ